MVFTWLPKLRTLPLPTWPVTWKPHVNPYLCGTLYAGQMPVWIQCQQFLVYQHWWINCDILVLSLVEPMSSSSPFVQGDVLVECLSNVCWQQLSIPAGHMGHPICSPLASSVQFKPVHTWFACMPQVLNWELELFSPVAGLNWNQNWTISLVQLVRVLCISSELNFGNPSAAQGLKPTSETPPYSGSHWVVQCAACNTYIANVVYKW